MRKRDPEAVAGAFVDAFNAENLDAMVAVLSESVEIQGGRGSVRGRDAAREWATRRPSGELRQRLLLDEVRTEGAVPVAELRRQWLWAETGEVADEQRLGVLVELDDEGLIRRWQPFDDPAEALAAAGLREAPSSE
jgi:hypothetical protein